MAEGKNKPAETPAAAVPAKPVPSTAPIASTAPTPPRPTIPTWGQLWQLPVLLLGVVLLIVWGVMRFRANAPHDNFSGGLDSVAQYLKANEFESAKNKINEMIPHLSRASEPEQARLRLLWGDLIHLSQKAHDSQTDESNERIVKLYTEAKEQGASLDPQRMQWLAEAYIGLGKQDEALKVVDELKDDSPSARYKLLRQVIDRISRTPHPDTTALVKLLSRFEGELRRETVADKRRPQEVWAISQQARLFMAAGSPTKAIEYLQRQLVQLSATGETKDLGEPMILYAQSLQRAGENEKARHWYMQAQQRINRDDPLNAFALVGLGQIDVAETGDYNLALAKFAEAEQQFSPTVSTAYFDALVGRANCEAHLGSHPDAIEHFGRAVEMVLADAELAEPRTEIITNTVRGHFELLTDKGDFDTALDYLSLLPRFYEKARELPSRMLSDFATTHEKIAVKRLGEAKLLPEELPDLVGEGGDAHGKDAAHGPATTESDLSVPVARAPGTSPGGAPGGHGESRGKAADAPAAKPGKPDEKSAASKDAAKGHEGDAKSPTTAPSEMKTAHKKPDSAKKIAFQQAAIHFGKAAEFYLRHSRSVSGSDDLAHGNSLWKAAECYERAQQWPQAVDVYADFVKTRPGDLRQPAALARLGLAYKADKQYPAAIANFRRLIDEHPRSAESYAALVPLAQAHMSQGDFDSAERVLKGVVTNNSAITPQSNAYKQALIELGKLYYEREQFERAIERLSVAVDRYGDSVEGASLRFRLADALRRSTPQISKTLEEPMAQSKRMALESERTRRLEQAQMLFSQVISELESPTRPPLGGPEKLFLRNAYFYRGDCAYDLGRYELAIGLYDVAAKRWEDQPASLVALVQIVNSYCRMGKVQQAKVVNARAKELLKRIPESAFDDPTLPMTRAQWEDWLRWIAELDLFNSQANAAKR